ncbi:MAG: type II toxin-antitoxin system RelE/ParE family toxin [Chloroflexi bacterium]|nr:type II toxin-antitoxin system RelE/ParE family toxin [Chloroflexota bacterium]
MPTLLPDPLGAGEPKRGDLAGVRAYNLNFRGVAYWLVYGVRADVVLFIAIGPHDDA